MKPTGTNLLVALTWAASMLATPIMAAAQLQPGMRLRIHTNAGGKALVGTLVAVSGDTLSVQAASENHLIVASTVRRVEMSQGIGNRGRQYAGVGAAAGAVGGALWGIFAHNACEANRQCFFENPGPEVVAGAFLGGAAGAGLGYLFGRTRKVEQWRRIELRIGWTQTRLQLVVRS